MSRFYFPAVVPALVVAASLCGCSGKDKPADTGQKQPAKAPSATYTVRGEVVALPVAGDTRTEFRVRHEAIDDFKDTDGKVVGMGSMTMEFPPAKGVDLSNLSKGDKVSVTFSVWWGQSPPWLATKVVKLPGDTALTFRKANPPAPAK